MENNKITAQSLLKICYEPYRNIYWFENGEITGPGLTAWVLEKLNQKIAAS
jgi:hypothetical protein